MKRKLGACLLAALLCLPMAAGALTAEERLADLDALCAGLEAGHKNLHAVVSREEFAQKREEAARRIAGMDDAAFFYELRQLTAAIGDAHTTLAYSDSPYAHLRALPFAVRQWQERWYLAMVDEPNGQYLGWEVTAIDGVPMAEVFTRAKGIISHENDVWAAQQFSNTINFLEALQFLGVTDAQAQGVTLALASRDGERESELFLPGMSEQEIMAARIVSLQAEATAATAPSGVYRAMGLSERTLFLQYNACMEVPDLPMRDFAQQVEALLVQNGYDTLLLDLRYNAGGDSSVWWPLREVLENVQARQGLTVYTLIGAQTFSSGIIDALESREYLGATLVGASTGGSVNGFGELKSFSLPNSPVTVWYSTKYFELVPGYEGSSLMPDIPVEETLEDWLAGRDSVVEAVLELL